MWGMFGAMIFSTTEKAITVVGMNADRRISRSLGDERTLPVNYSNSAACFLAGFDEWGKCVVLRLYCRI